MPNRLLTISVLALSLASGPITPAHGMDATPCWNGGSVPAFNVTAPSGKCARLGQPCGPGLTCIEVNYTFGVDCRGLGNESCTYCFRVYWGHYPPTGGFVVDSTDNLASGVDGCGSNNGQHPASQTKCVADGDHISIVAALYDSPCSTVTTSTPWVQYRDMYMTVPTTIQD